MTYAVVDQSVADGQPIELYEFKQGLSTWRYTSAVFTVTVLAADYEPATIVRSGITQSNEASGAGISLTFPRDHEFARQFLGLSPDIVTTLTIYRSHVTDVDAEYQAYWKGRVVAGKASGSELTLECESVFTSMRRAGLRARYQLSCRHTLYSESCGVNMDSYKSEALVQSVTGSTITCTVVGGFADGYFTGGIVKLPSGAMRFIVGHTSATLTLSRPFIESVGGMTVEVFPGCDHLKTTCHSKFNNLLNFGGFPYIPSVNPFGGTSIA